MGLAIAFAVLLFLLGASVGSFLNVVIYRLPAGGSVVRPASHCPACQVPIKPWHNLPVLGWLLVRGRCASCSVPISVRYPLIETIMGLISLALFHDFAGGPLTAQRLASGAYSAHFLPDVLSPYVLYMVLAAGLVAIAFIDLDGFVIPDSLSLPGIPLGIATSAAVGHVIGVTWHDALIGAALGGVVLVVVILVYGWLTGREGMGGGDWKLLAVLGAYLGWQALPFVLFAASIQGILMALVLGRGFAVEELPPDPGARTEDAPGGESGEAVAPARTDGPGGGAAKPFGQLAIPFGPFLALAACEYLLFYQNIHAFLAAYLGFG